MADSLCSAAERQRVLHQLPQVAPFRFIDEILELSADHIVATYHFTGKEWFYAGHFPDDPVTPGVILIEALAQAGLVALGIYIYNLESPGTKLRTLFSECSTEFLNVVRPGERVTVVGQKKYWRRNKLQSEVELRKENGELAVVGTVSGLGVPIV